jgi:hypothetical protein
MKIQWHTVTWYSKILALVLFVALPFIGFYFGIQYGTAKQSVTDAFANTKNTLSADADAYYKNISEWQTDQNNAGWSIAYPIDFNINDVYVPVATDNWRQGTPGGSGLQLFTLTIPRAFEPQTNFSDATLSVGMSGQAGAIAQCLVPEQMPNQTATSSAMINGAVFTVFHLSDAGAGNYYETTSYRTIHQGQCYAVEYTIHSGQIANYPAEYQLKPLDETKLHDLLDRIVGTFQFK